MSCEYCDGSKSLYRSSGRQLLVVDGWTNPLGMELKGWQLIYGSWHLDDFFSVSIKYCPKCGRKLGDEL